MNYNTISDLKPSVDQKIAETEKGSWISIGDIYVMSISSTFTFTFIWFWFWFPFLVQFGANPCLEVYKDIFNILHFFDQWLQSYFHLYILIYTEIRDLSSFQQSRSIHFDYVRGMGWQNAQTGWNEGREKNTNFIDV